MITGALKSAACVAGWLPLHVACALLIFAGVCMLVVASFVDAAADWLEDIHAHSAHPR